MGTPLVLPTIARPATPVAGLLDEAQLWLGDPGVDEGAPPRE